MKFLIEYSGGRADATWHGKVIVEADDAAQALRKIEMALDCIPASVDAINPADPDLGPIKEGHTCKHGVRWPHYCQPCEDDNWKLEQERIALHP